MNLLLHQLRLRKDKVTGRGTQSGKEVKDVCRWVLPNVPEVKKSLTAGTKFNQEYQPAGYKNSEGHK
jgi:hypothetical protein